MKNEHQVCNRCVMDNTSDDQIEFDPYGNCNYCSTELKRKDSVYFPNDEGKKKLDGLISIMKKDGQGSRYDCMMGISGGLDSAYLAYLGSKWGLRILAVHIDDGFDTEIAKSNIDNLCRACGINLITVKPDENQFLDLTKAYILAEVPNLAVPQDNILFANLNRIAKKNKVKYFLSGGNFSLECVLQHGNTHNAYDVVNIKSIEKKFGEKGINKLTFMSLLEKKIKYEYLYRIKQFRPLNYIDYSRESAIRELKENCNFEYYGSKHTENNLTKFTQLIWLPEKFQVDKRKSHLSSMIVSNQLTRDEALKELKNPIISSEEREKCIYLISNQLGIEIQDLEKLLSQKGKAHTDYKTSFIDKKIVEFLRR